MSPVGKGVRMPAPKCNPRVWRGRKTARARATARARRRVAQPLLRPPPPPPPPNRPAGLVPGQARHAAARARARRAGGRPCRARSSRCRWASAATRSAPSSGSRCGGAGTGALGAGAREGHRSGAAAVAGRPPTAPRRVRRASSSRRAQGRRSDCSIHLPSLPSALPARRHECPCSSPTSCPARS